MERSTAIYFAKQAMGLVRYRGVKTGTERYQGREYPWQAECQGDDAKGKNVWAVAISTWEVLLRYDGALVKAVRLI